jgi:hypothetical protein
MEFTRDGLEGQSFVGFVRLGGPDAGRPPAAAGVYVVYRPAIARPVFLAVSGAGHFKDRDPSKSTSVLEGARVAGAQVVYIGKAALRKGGIGGLRIRIGEYRRFGAGEPIGHWGGRYVWQLADCADLLVAWRVTANTEDPRAAESALIKHFVARYGVLPFANLRR